MGLAARDGGGGDHRGGQLEIGGAHPRRRQRRSRGRDQRPCPRRQRREQLRGACDGHDSIGFRQLDDVDRRNFGLQLIRGFGRQNVAHDVDSAPTMHMAAQFLKSAPHLTATRFQARSTAAVESTSVPSMSNSNARARISVPASSFISFGTSWRLCSNENVRVASGFAICDNWSPFRDGELSQEELRRLAPGCVVVPRSRSFRDALWCREAIDPGQRLPRSI